MRTARQRRGAGLSGAAFAARSSRGRRAPAFAIVIAGLLGAALPAVAAPAPALAPLQPPPAQPPPVIDDLLADAVDRPVSRIVFEGLKRVSEQEVRNNIRIAVGEPYDPQTHALDIQRLYRLGQFKYIDGSVILQPDGSVWPIYRFTEEQIINEVQVVGNRLIPDADLVAVAQQFRRGPRDDSLIQTARRRIEEMYKQRGHYLTTVQVDESELDQSGVLIFRVIEGPRVKVRAVEFEGNDAFRPEQLEADVRTRPAMFLFRRGELDEDLLRDDVAALDRFYRDRGYLDVRVDRRIELSPDNKEAKVTFIIAEGEQYQLRALRVRRPDGSPTRVFAPEQIAAILEIKTGDAYSADLVRKSVEALQQAYGIMGYADVYLPNAIRTQALRVPDEQAVDLDLIIAEGRQYIVGNVQIQGNFLTRDRIVRRELRGLEPGLPMDATQVLESHNRLMQTRLFSDVRITPQAADPQDLTYRDVLVEVKERSTGSVNFGVALGSDSGLFGEVSLNQRNFDITDWPESLDEFLSGRAFRGAGQQFSATLRPGTEIFQFAVNWAEPRLMDSDYSLSVGGQFRTRFYELYDEERFGAQVSLGRRFGDIWAASLRTRAENVELSNIAPESPTAIFADAGPNTLTAVGFSITRSTFGTALRPVTGSRLELAIDRFGALGGDFDFTAVSSDYTVYFTINEDFLGRRSTLRLTNRMSYVFDGDAPVYELNYLGGRSMRGFEFRTISPKGIRADNGLPSDEPIGGEWLFFLGAQYEFPLWGEALSGVVFVDSGTVLDDFGFDDYRVSIGAGLRILIPQLGDVPIALDFGFPIVKEEGDEQQIFSFSAELPFY